MTCSGSLRHSRMMTNRKVVAVLCIGLVLFAAFTPVVALHTVAVVLEPVWTVFVPPTSTLIRPEVVRVVEQTFPLVAARFSRPPPVAA
jgi:hypothetical protein